MGLGRVFTANMTGNVVLLGFGFAGAPGISVERSLTSLAAFFLGAIIGGRIAAALAPVSSQKWTTAAFGTQAILLLGATLVSMHYRPSAADSIPLYMLIVLMALAMGIRNATVRRIGVEDLTAMVLTTTITGLAAESSLAGGSN